MDFVAVAAGGAEGDSGLGNSGHSLGLKADGSIVAWGLNDYGQCDVPAPNTDFVTIAGGYRISLGIKGYLSCPGDLDGDGDTDHADLGALLGAWDSQPGDPHWNENADLDGNGHIGHGDLGILLGDWGCGT